MYIPMFKKLSCANLYVRPKYLEKKKNNNNNNNLLKYLSVSKFWNIGIDGQSNIGNWTNIGEKKLKISVKVSKK